MTIVLPQPAVRFSGHAVDRYINRVLQAGDRQRAEQQLTALALSGEITASPPNWFGDRAKEEADRYLVIADLVFPLVLDARGTRWLAKTCIPRGYMSDDVRRRRNIAKSRRSQSRRGQSRAVDFVVPTAQPC
jgi:hypothetical protein